MAFTHKAALYANLFPRVGIEGTVKALLSDTPLAGKLALKSGSMKGVLCYAGYKLDETGTPTHAVVVMVNGFTCKMTTVRKAIAEFLLERFPQPDCNPKNPTIDKTFRNR
jgi:D-alanyl-D-alanine carboxypeptidase/D-alanyl-D-alanine-endopeptidase